MIILVSTCKETDPILDECTMTFDGRYRGKEIKEIKITNRSLLKGRNYMLGLDIKEIKEGVMITEMKKGNVIN